MCVKQTLTLSNNHKTSLFQNEDKQKNMNHDDVESHKFLHILGKPHETTS